MGENTTPTRQDRKRDKQRAQRIKLVERAAEKKRLADLHAAAVREADEARDERVAPGVQRKAIEGADGQVYREARVQREGLVFIRSNPIAHLVKRNLHLGDKAPVRPEHQMAVARLLFAWDAVGEGVGVSAVDYERASGGGGSGEGGLSMELALQMDLRQDLDAAATWLGGFWPIVRDVALKGLTVTAWAAANRKDRDAAVLFLGQALDRLVLLYVERERKPAMRSIEIRERG